MAHEPQNQIAKPSAELYSRAELEVLRRANSDSRSPDIEQQTKSFRSRLESRAPTVFGLFLRELLVTAFGEPAANRTLAGSVVTRAFNLSLRSEEVIAPVGTAFVVRGPSFASVADSMRKSGEHLGVVLAFVPDDEPLTGLVRPGDLADLVENFADSSRDAALELGVSIEVRGVPPVELDLPEDLPPSDVHVLVHAPQRIRESLELSPGKGDGAFARVPLDRLTMIDETLLGWLEVIPGSRFAGFVSLPQNWQTWRVKEKLPPAVRAALEEAPAAELSLILTRERLRELETAKLVEEIGHVEGDLPRSLNAKLMRVSQALDDAHIPIRALLTQLIDETNALPAERRTLSSLDANREFASVLQRLLTAVGARLCCPSCGYPGTLRVRQGNTQTGAFEFRHGQRAAPHDTCGGQTTIPILKLHQG